jgi:hypothetical protein
MSKEKEIPEINLKLEEKTNPTKPYRVVNWF